MRMKKMEEIYLIRPDLTAGSFNDIDKEWFGKRHYTYTLPSTYRQTDRGVTSPYHI